MLKSLVLENKKVCCTLLQKNFFSAERQASLSRLHGTASASDLDTWSEEYLRSLPKEARIPLISWTRCPLFFAHRPHFSVVSQGRMCIADEIRKTRVFRSFFSSFLLLLPSRPTWWGWPSTIGTTEA